MAGIQTYRPRAEQAHATVLTVSDPQSIDEAIKSLRSWTTSAELHHLVEHYLAVFDPDELLPRLKDESERYQRTDPWQSLTLAEALILAGEIAVLPRYHALGLLAKGSALGVIGDSSGCVQTLDDAGREFLACGDEVGWARTRIFWLVASHRLGRGSEALHQGEQAREVLARHGIWLRAAGLDHNSAYVSRELGRYDRALELYDRAQSAYETLGPSAASRVGWTKQGKANILTVLGEFQSALRLHEEARSIFVDQGDTVDVFRQDENIGSVYAGLGYTTRALRIFAATLASLDASGLFVDAGWVALKSSDCYLTLNRFDDAIDMAMDAANRFQRHGTATEAAKALATAAVAHARRGDAARALELLDQAGVAFDAAGMATHIALVALHRAVLHLSQRRWTEAGEEASRARALLDAQGLVLPCMQADLIEAKASLAIGNGPAASRLADSALTTAKAHGVLAFAQEAHHVLGQVAELQGDLPRALEAYERAIDGIEGMQRVLAVELQTNFLDDKIQVYHDAVETSVRLGRIESALGFLERAKSRALVDYLGRHVDIRLRSRDKLDAQTMTELTRLREEHRWYYNRLYGTPIIGRDSELPSSPEETQLRSALVDRERSISRIVESLAIDRSEGAAPAWSDQGQAALLPHVDEDAAILEYYLGDRGSYAFVIAGNIPRCVPLAVGPADVRQMLQQWHLNLEATSQAIAAGTMPDRLSLGARRILGAMHRALIGPVLPWCAGRRRLIVVPYGPLHSAPFHAFFDGSQYLLETFEVSTTPSCDVLRLCRIRAAARPHNQPSALVVGHSDGGRLASVIAESRAVASLFGGERLLENEATRDAVTTAAPHHCVLHLAAHGEARLDNPTFAHLKLDDGQLSILDIFNLELDGALVTLSACESGKAVVTAGDELVGLSRGFLYAGAATLVQSLWRVEDSSTASIMRRFYTELREGRSKGQALRQAQLSALHGGGTHPYSWAAFQLIGDDGPLV